MVSQKYLLDTNVISEMRKGRKAHPKVTEWVGSVHVNQQYLSVICLMEIRIGIFSVLKKDPSFGNKLDLWYTRKLKPAFTNRILNISESEADCFAQWSRLRTLPFRDGFIAATAKVNALTLVTRNVKDFHGLGLKIINPWE